MLKFDDFTFEIPEGVKKPCVNVSGGVDSALALYLTVLELDKYNGEITVLTLCHPNKNHYNSVYSTQVVNKIINITNTKSIKNHLIFYKDIQKRKYLDIEEEKLYNKGFIDFTIHGTTKNPTNVIDLQVGGTSSRDNTTFIPELGKHHLCNIQRYMPFIKIDKKSIFNAYKKLKLLDTLLPYTKSCESFDVNLHESCNECWWCKERAWGLNSIER